MSETLVTKKAAAEFLRVSVQALDGWFTRGCPVFERTDAGHIKRLCLEDVVEWRIGRAGEISEYNAEEERARLLHHQANNEALKEKQNRRELIPASEIRDVWSDMVAAMRAKLLALPGRLANKALSFESTKEAEEFATQEVHEALNELGDALTGKS